jgi:hypothetical protein
MAVRGITKTDPVSWPSCQGRRSGRAKQPDLRQQIRESLEKSVRTTATRGYARLLAILKEPKNTQKPAKNSKPDTIAGYNEATGFCSVPTLIFSTSSNYFRIGTWPENTPINMAKTNTVPTIGEASSTASKA